MKLVEKLFGLESCYQNFFEALLDPTIIHCDTQSCTRLTEDPVFHARTKHINIKYHYILSLVQDGVVKIQYISIDEHLADILTKSLLNKKLVEIPMGFSAVTQGWSY